MAIGLAKPTPKIKTAPRRMESRAGRRTAVAPGAALTEAASVLIMGTQPYRCNGLRS
jgi:hypothetical protein